MNQRLTRTLLRGWAFFLFLFLFLLLLLSLGAPVFADPCPFCRVPNPERANFCGKCLRPLSWTEKPPPGKACEVVVRRGFDAFIRGPNDAHPRQKSAANAGMDKVGAVGAYYSLSGLRYLIRFNIPEAFAQSGVSLEDFLPEQALLVLRVASDPAAIDDIPIIVHPLQVPFQQGWGRWGKHNAWEKGCTWTLAGQNFPWNKPGGDYSEQAGVTGVIPARGFAEIEIDVTSLILPIFTDYRRTGAWFNPGFIVMRDESRFTRGLFRLIHSFESALEPGMTAKNRQVISPELYLK